MKFTADLCGDAAAGARGEPSHGARTISDEDFYGNDKCGGQEEIWHGSTEKMTRCTCVC